MKIIAVRIRGRVNIAPDVKRALDLLRLRKKFNCVVVDNKPEIMGAIKKVQNYIAFGPVEEEILKLLISKRAKQGKKQAKIGKKEINEFVKDFMQGKVKLTDFKINPFFKLHPPRGGFKKETRLMWPKGVLGNQNKEINKLIKRML